MSKKSDVEQQVFQERDLLFMSPFTWDRTVAPVEEERVSQRGRPYKVTRMSVKPLNAPNTFLVEVFERTARTIKILAATEGGIIVASESPANDNGYTNIILSLRKEGAVRR